jgi:hypothetical protein
MKSKIVLAALLFLSACAHPIQPVKTEWRVVKPDAIMYKCDVTKLPDPNTLTDVQVAQLINDLYANANVCKNNMEAIKKYLETAEKILESK